MSRFGQAFNIRRNPVTRAAGSFTRSPLNSSMFNIKFDMFFDRQSVISAVNRSERRVMLSAGAYIWRIARNSLKMGRRMRLDEIKHEHVGRVLGDMRTKMDVNYRYLATDQLVNDIRDKHSRRLAWKRKRRRLKSKSTRGGLSPSEQKTLDWLDRSTKYKRLWTPRIASAPGQPPKIKSAGSPLKKLIRFGYDPKLHGVVIGPLLFRSGTQVGDADTLEYGGISRQSRHYVAARPFMRPAEAKARSRNVSLFKDFIR